MDMLVICGFTIIKLVEVDKIDKGSKNNGHFDYFLAFSVLQDYDMKRVPYFYADTFVSFLPKL